MLTDDGRYVGLRQEDADVDELVSVYVDENAEPGDEGGVESDLATGPWQTWADAGGDLAYSTTLTEGADEHHGRHPAGLRLGEPWRPGAADLAAHHRTTSDRASFSRRLGWAASSRSRTPSSHCWQTVARCSPRSQRASDSSRVMPPASSRRTVSTSSSRAAS